MRCKQCKREIALGSTFCNWCGKKQVTDKQQGEISIPRARQLSSGRWFIQLRSGGKSVSITEDTEELCKVKARAIKTGLIKARPNPSNITLSDAIEKYIDYRKNIVSPSTIRTYKDIQRVRFKELMNCRLPDITLSKLQQAISEEMQQDENGRSISAKTIKDSYCFIKTVLINNNINLDYKRVALPQVQPSPYLTLTPDEIKILIAAISESECEIPILLAIWLGLRRSEIMALEKKDFDFKKQTVTISAALVQDENNKYVIKGTKCAASVRTLSCPEYILEKVHQLPDGKIYNMYPNYIIRTLHRICKENDLPPVRLHDLRHINASIMLLLNVPDKYAMERGGWATKQTMTGRYQHTYDAEKISIDNKINSYFEGLLKRNSSDKIANI